MVFNMKKIISYSLWGSEPMFNIGALRNSELSQLIYPGWTCRFYVDETVPKNIINKLKENKCEVIVKEKVEGHLASLWRFEPFFDKDISYFIVRDTDDRLSLREKKAVDEWISLDLPIHIMRDHPNHTWEIMAGMWGGVPFSVPTFEKDFKKYYNNPPPKGDKFRDQFYFTSDQQLLRDFLWPFVKDTHIAHDEFNRLTGKELRFPTARKNEFDFVGQKYTEKDEPVYSVNKR